jgi:hypothetical protein
VAQQEYQTMDRETTYKGQHIHIVTQRAADGEWRARAELAGSAPVETAAYPSEQEAYAAALSAAAALVDRVRERVGKP